MKAASTMLAALLLLPIPVAAANLPVSYLVQDKPLKAAVAGTNLTFDLYADSACTGPIVHTETVAIENVAVLSKLKLFVPKGATKPPATDELHHTLVAVAAASTRYLKVSGTGITPVGTACQAQGSVTVGVPVFQDADGTILGPVSTDISCGLGALFSAPTGPVFVAIGSSYTVDQYTFCTFVYFASPDCTGTPLMSVDARLARLAQGVNSLLYIPAASGGSSTVLSSLLHPASVASCSSPGETFVPPAGCCSPYATTQFVAPVAQTLGFNPPFSLATP